VCILCVDFRWTLQDGRLDAFEEQLVQAAQKEKLMRDALTVVSHDYPHRHPMPYRA
jgi:hypothetical protein